MVTLLDTKICKICGNVKTIITDFRHRKSLGKYSGTCKVCERIQIYNSNIVRSSIQSNKICINCKETKDISNFSFFKSENRFSSYCKSCDNRRIKTLLNSKEYYKRNRVSGLLNDYRKIDKLKNFENDLTKDFVKKQLIHSCVYCSYPSTGFDRINNRIGHLQINCVPCCKECNIARMDNFSHEEMFIIGKSIKQIKDTRSCQLLN